jgi:hypothetical protein
LEAKASDSSHWKPLARVWPNYAQFGYRFIGNDRAALAWHRSWIKVDGKISDLVDEIPTGLQHMTVTEWGNWYNQMLYWLPNVLEKRLTKFCHHRLN